MTAYPISVKARNIVHRHNQIWSLWEMLKVEGHALIGALNILSDLDSLGRQNAASVYGDSQVLDYMRRNMDLLISQLKVLELRLAIKKAEAIQLKINSFHSKYDAETIASAISRNLDELRDRIEDELEERALYYITPRKAELMRDTMHIYGQAISDKFPDASTDLSEAAACLAMSRNTASVFHLMRAMECAVKEIGAKLGATIIDKNNLELSWGKIISNINKKIEIMVQGEERNRWSEVSAHLYHVKQCWRNSTMHPKQTYTEEEAGAVFEAVKSFLRRLADVL